MASRRKKRPKRSTSRPRATGRWAVEDLATATGRRGGHGDDPFLDRLVATGGLEVASRHEATVAVRRGAAAPPVAFDFTPPDDASYVAIGRHASGAVFFSFGEPAGRRRSPARAPGRPATLRFTLKTRGAQAPGPARRGLVGRVVKFVIVKLLDRLADLAIPKLARLWEERTWRSKGLPRGLLQVRLGADGTARLAPVGAPAALAGGRSLLFLHGTFSDFQGAFGDLLRTTNRQGRTFFDLVRATHGERLFAFNHSTVSETPADNAEALLKSLPEDGGTFDVITHSRGALVLRSLLDRGRLGPLADRFRLGRAVLVAGPNGGTPLVSPRRWETLTTWLANLIDLFPDTPFTTGAEFIVEALAWVAGKVGGVVPGLASMDPDGRFLRDLTSVPVPVDRCSALAASFEPDQGVLARMADVGVDGFFGEDNDLVVPTAGGWKLGEAPGATIPGERVGRYGPGGNLPAGGSLGVHHLNFFGQPASVDFLARGVLGQPQQAAAAAAAGPGGGRRAVPGNGGAGPVQPALAGSLGGDQALPGSGPAGRPAPFLDEVLHLLIVAPDAALAEAAEAAKQPGMGGDDAGDAERTSAAAQAGTSGTALLIASFRNARVIEPFRTKGGEAGQRFKRIIARHEQIKGYVDGKPSVKALPNQRELRAYGAVLFDTLFPGQVRRLYDSARSELKDRRLNVCLTSMIEWVADKPWEFAYDRSRKTFLCTEEVNFIRNSLTAVPADALSPRGDKLRILVVAAQPIGAGALSVADEEGKIRSAFSPLIEHDLADIQVEVRVTPQRLHQLLTVADVADQPYDVLHFIGHGEYDQRSRYGYLLFEDAEGRSQEMRADVFRQIVARRDIRLVFLNACETGLGMGGQQGPGRAFDFSQGVAPMLVQGGVPSVVANQFKVLDVSATAFAQHFYWALAVGRTIGDAAREARVAVNYSIAGEAIDWAVPVLFARNPDDVLVSRPAGPPSGPAAPLPRPMARAAGPRRSPEGAATRRVAIWDVNYVVPNLDRVVARLNEVQSHYHFEAVDLIAPLGTWRRSADHRESRAFLYAKEVESKLRPTLRSLGASHLCCLTNMPLRDRSTKDLSAHSTDDGLISIFSTHYLLPRLAPPALSLERLIANFLAFVLSGLTEHRRPPRNCPVYFNDEEDIRWNAGPVSFCPGCLAKLRRNPAREALKALLKAY